MKQVSWSELIGLLLLLLVSVEYCPAIVFYPLRKMASLCLLLTVSAFQSMA